MIPVICGLVVVRSSYGARCALRGPNHDCSSYSRAQHYMYSPTLKHALARTRDPHARPPRASTERSVF